MPNVRKAIDITAEVEHGLAKELGILNRWLKSQGAKNGVGDVYRLDEYNDFDYLALSEVNGFPVCYIEIKSRRSPVSKYGDCIMPLRKHTRAKELWQEHKVPALCVTEYGDGCLVQVNITHPPAKTMNIRRKDRPGTPPVPHAVYSKSQMRLIG